MNCPNCFSNNLKFDSKITHSNEIKTNTLYPVLNVQCLNCLHSFYIADIALIQEFTRLIKLEQAVNELHFYISNHPTFQRMSANENEPLDALLCEIESFIELETSYVQKT